MWLSTKMKKKNDFIKSTLNLRFAMREEIYWEKTTFVSTNNNIVCFDFFDLVKRKKFSLDCNKSNA